MAKAMYESFFPLASPFGFFSSSLILPVPVPATSSATATFASATATATAASASASTSTASLLSSATTSSMLVMEAASVSAPPPALVQAARRLRICFLLSALLWIALCSTILIFSGAFSLSFPIRSTLTAFQLFHPPNSVTNTLLPLSQFSLAYTPSLIAFFQQNYFTALFSQVRIIDAPNFHAPIGGSQPAGISGSAAESPFASAVSDSSDSSSYSYSGRQLRNGFVIATATSANHFIPLMYMIQSIYLNWPLENDKHSANKESKEERLKREAELGPLLLYVYDLGCEVEQIESLKLFAVKNWRSDRLHLHIRAFPFEKYPPFISNMAGTAGQYAWKPLILSTLISENPQIPVLWIDAGAYFLSLNIIYDKLLHIQHTYTYPVYAAATSSTHGEKTFPAMFEYFNDSIQLFASERHIEAGMVGLGYTSELLSDIVKPWAACAVSEQCIAPAGSSRSNHRQDQSVISYLLSKHQVPVAAQQDFILDGIHRKCDRNIYHTLFPLNVMPNMHAYSFFCGV